MNTQVVIEGLQALVVFYRELLSEKFWLRAKEMLESVFTDDNSSFETRREAISEAIHQAFEPAHWQIVCECAAHNHLLLNQEMQLRFFDACDTDALVWFATDEKVGLIPTTLSEISTAEDFDGGIFQKVHTVLSALQQLVLRDKEFQPTLTAVAGVMEGYCTFLGNNSPQLKKRFDEILGQPKFHQEVPASVSAKTATVAPSAPAKPGNAKSPQSGVKPGKPDHSKTKPKYTTGKPNNNPFKAALGDIKFPSSKETAATA